MAQNIQDEQTSQPNCLRRSIVDKIWHIKSCERNLNWSCYCHAITVADVFEQRQPGRFVELFKDQVMQWVFAVACILLASKYLTGRGFSISTLISKIGSFQEERQQEIVENVLEMEEIILEGIEFQFPTLNGIDYLESLTKTDQFQVPESRSKIVASLKILLTAYAISTVLSHSPSLALQIYKIVQTSRKRGSPVQKLYKDCLRQIRQGNISA